MKVRVTKEKVFSYLVAFFPLLSVYKSVVPGIDLGTACLILFFLWAMTMEICVNEMTLLILYIVVLTPFAVFFSEDYGTSEVLILFRIIKIVIALGIVFLGGCNKKYYNEIIVFGTMRKIIYINCVYIVLQRVLYLIGFILPNPFMQFATFEGYTDGYNMVSHMLFRPSGFFCEPSHFAVYGLVFLIYSLFCIENYKDTICVVTAIICTGSGIGLVMMSCVLGIYFIRRLRNKITVRRLIMFSGSVAALAGFTMTSFFDQVTSRFLTKNIMGGGNAIEARIGLGYQLFLQKNWLQRLFGSGYGNVPANIYLNGMTYVLNTLGIVGTVLFFTVLIKYFMRACTWKKVGILTVCALTFISQIFTSASLVFYLCVYCGNVSTHHRDK